MQGFGAAACGLAVDGVLDVAQDALAGGGAVLGRGGLGRLGLGEPLGQADGAADGAGDALEGNGAVGEVGRVGALVEGLGLGVDLAVDEAEEAGGG